MQSWQEELSRLSARGQQNRMENIALSSSEITEAWTESGQDFITVRLNANLLDYTVDRNSGAVVSGSATSRSNSKSTGHSAARRPECLEINRGTAGLAFTTKLLHKELSHSDHGLASWSLFFCVKAAPADNLDLQLNRQGSNARFSECSRLCTRSDSDLRWQTSISPIEICMNVAQRLFLRARPLISTHCNLYCGIRVTYLPLAGPDLIEESALFHFIKVARIDHLLRLHGFGPGIDRRDFIQSRLKTFELERKPRL